METSTWRHRHGDKEFLKIKWKTEAQRQFPLIRLPFAQCEKKNGSFVVCPFADEETNGDYPFANGLNGLAHLWTNIPGTLATKL